MDIPESEGENVCLNDMLRPSVHNRNSACDGDDVPKFVYLSQSWDQTVRTQANGLVRIRESREKNTTNSTFVIPFKFFLSVQHSGILQLSALGLHRPVSWLIFLC